MKKNMKKIIIGLLLLCLIGLPSLSVRGSETDNTVIYFSGLLKDVTGDGAESGSYNMAFKVYDSFDSDNQIWEEKFIGEEKIEIILGQFQVSLGQKVPLILDTESKGYWVGITIGGLEDSFEWDDEMMPRIPIMTLENFLLGGSAGLSDKDFMDLLLEEFEATMGEGTGLTQADFLVYLQERLANNEGQAVIISPDSLSRMLDVVMEYEQADTIIEEEITRAEETDNEVGFLRAVMNFFKRTLDAISGTFSQIFVKLSDIFTKITGIEDNVENILAILEDGPENAEQQVEFENLTKDSGEGSILPGNKSVIIESTELTKLSRIFVSPKTDITGIWWISDRVDGDYFEVSILASSEREIFLDYWIVGPEEEEVVEAEFSPVEIIEIVEEPILSEESEKEQVVNQEEPEEFVEDETVEPIIEEAVFSPIVEDEEELIEEMNEDEEQEEAVEASLLEVVEPEIIEKTSVETVE